jgi:NADPH-dependent curcumin reductase CurA
MPRKRFMPTITMRSPKNALSAAARAIIAGELTRRLIDLPTKPISTIGDVILEHHGRFDAFRRDILRWLAERSVTMLHHLADYFKRSPSVVAGLFAGQNDSKTIANVHR